MSSGKDLWNWGVLGMDRKNQGVMNDASYRAQNEVKVKEIHLQESGKVNQKVDSRASNNQ